MPCSGAHIIVTSRWSDWFGHAEALPVDVFPLNVAVDYLMEQARYPDRQAAARLADLLGRFPRALNKARAICWRMNCRFEEYPLENDLTLNNPVILGSNIYSHRKIFTQVSEAKQKLRILKELDDLIDREINLDMQRTIVTDLLRVHPDDKRKN
jgi:hypothetical protein